MRFGCGLMWFGYLVYTIFFHAYLEAVGHESNFGDAVGESRLQSALRAVVYTQREEREKTRPLCQNGWR